MLLIVACVGVFIWQTQFPTDATLNQVGLTSAVDQSAVEYGALPYRVTHPSDSECFLGAVRQDGGGRAAEIVCEGQERLAEAEAFGPTLPLDQAAWWVTLFMSMFMHGGILHLAGNMLFLWIFGNNVEDSMGRLRFLLFYVLAGLIAVYGQSLIDPASTVPTVGASGAIAGVLGGYMLLFPQARVLTLVIIIFFVTLIEVPAVIMLGVWFVLQFIPAIGQAALTDIGGGAGIAYFAHVGGFLFGLAAIKLFARRPRLEAPPAWSG